LAVPESFTDGAVEFAGASHRHAALKDESRAGLTPRSGSDTLPLQELSMIYPEFTDLPSLPFHRLHLFFMLPNMKSMIRLHQ
jgi:hypothetical protein